MTELKKRGRKPGTLARFKCRICGNVEAVSGGSNHFVCSTCISTASFMRSEFTGRGAAYAMGLVHKAVSEGRLAAIGTCMCVDCGNVAQHYDHRDYNKPLAVDPVCHSCNLKRGPAVPRIGFFADMYRTGDRYYRRLADTKLLFKAIGVEADLSGLPKSLKFEHWLPFKDVLLEWEAKALQ